MWMKGLCSSDDIRLCGRCRAEYGNKFGATSPLPLTPGSKLKDWLSDPVGRKIAEKYLGTVLDSPMLALGQEMILIGLVRRLPHMLAPTVVDRMMEDLKGICF
jgi:hypothetical protein